MRRFRTFEDRASSDEEGPPRKARKLEDFVIANRQQAYHFSNPRILQPEPEGLNFQQLLAARRSKTRPKRKQRSVYQLFILNRLVNDTRSGALPIERPRHGKIKLGEPNLFGLGEIWERENERNTLGETGKVNSSDFHGKSRKRLDCTPRSHIRGYTAGYPRRFELHAGELP